jgi:hypothetical protein
MNTRMTLGVMVGSILALICGCGSKDTGPKAPSAAQVAEQLQKLFPGFELKADAQEGLADQYQTHISKKDEKGMALVTLNHKGKFSTNGPVSEAAITFRRAHIPTTQDELLSCTDGLLRAVGHAPTDAKRIAEEVWKMSNPQKIDAAVSQVYLQDGDYLSIVDGRKSEPPYININTFPKGTKGTPPPKGAAAQR